jgi:hypothetical protein
MRVLAVGIATALLYVGLAAWVPLLPTNLYEPLLDLGKITGYSWRSAVAFALLIASLYVLYGFGYRLAVRGQASTAPIFVFGAVFCATMLAAYPATAVDVFGYVAHGRLEAFHQANPFVVGPAAFPGDTILPYLAFPREPSQYGALWVLLGTALASLAKANLLTDVLLYKLVGAAAHLLSAFLILKTAPRLGATDCLARGCALVFLWNPLLLWEMVGNAHNDGLMMLGVLLAVWLLMTNRDLLVLPALALAALVKVPVVILAPLFCVAVWQKNRATAIEGFWLALVLAVLVYRPFWEGLDTLTALRRTDLFTASLGSVLRLALEPGLGQATATTIARSISLAAFACVVVGSLFYAVVRGARLELAYITMLAAALLATTWFQAWYLVWPIALGAVLPSARRHLEVALLSLGGFAQYFVFIYLWVIGVFPPEETLGLQFAAFVGIVGPLVLGLLVWRYARVDALVKEPQRAN